MSESRLSRSYRLALAMLPRPFRERHRAEIERHFETLLADTTAPYLAGKRFLILIRAVADVMWTATMLRVQSSQPEHTRMKGSLYRDVAYALRGLTRSPAFAIAAVMTLALGLGAATTIFSVVNGVLMRPLPYSSPGRLVNIWVDFGVGGQSLPAVSTADFLDYKTQATLFQDFAAASGGGTIGATGILTGRSEAPEKVDVSPVTSNFFPLLGVKPVLGRQFTKEEEAFRGPRVVMLSHELWQRRYGGDSTLVGRTIELDGLSQQVVGVLPPGFHLLLPAEAFLVKDSQIWKPLQINLAQLQPRNYTGLTVFGRLKPGVTYSQAQAEMDRVAAWLRATFPVHAAGQIRIRAVPLQDDIVKGARPALQLLLVAAVLVLVIVCANVANLLLTRASVRERELAVRIAMGASRFQIARQLLTEGFVLAALGTVLGLAFTYASIAYLSHLQPANLPRLSNVTVDWRVLGFAAAACVVTALVFGLAPALHGARSSTGAVLRGGVRVAGGRGARLRQGLIVGEIALSLVLLVSAGLLVRSFISLQDVRPGFEPNGLLTFRVSLPFANYRAPDAAKNLYESLRARLLAIPGVTAVGGISQLPLTGSGPLSPYAYNEATARNWESVTADGRFISPDYFATMGTKLVAGRTFTTDDDAKHPPVIVIDESIAKQAFPNGDAVGRQLQVGPTGDPGAFATVVGVVQHMRIHDLGDDVRGQIYNSSYAAFSRNFAVVVRTDGRAYPIAAVRKAVAELDPNLPVSGLRPMRELVDDALAPARFSLLLMEGLGSLALFLALIGVYGVISFSVAQRTREFGVRMALGQAPGELRRAVVAQALKVILPSIGLGIVVAALSTRFLDGLLYGVHPLDPATFTIVPLGLIVVATLACDAPARRASRVDPLVALREE